MQIGDKVAWKSHGGGKYTTKRGKIVRVLKLGEVLFKVARKEFPDYVVKFTGWNIPGKGTTSHAYFVEVGISPTACPRLYMPLPKRLVKEPNE